MIWLALLVFCQSSVISYACWLAHKIDMRTQAILMIMVSTARVSVREEEEVEEQ